MPEKSSLLESLLARTSARRKAREKKNAIASKTRKADAGELAPQSSLNRAAKRRRRTKETLPAPSLQVTHSSVLATRSLMSSSTGSEFSRTRRVKKPSLLDVHRILPGGSTAAAPAFSSLSAAESAAAYAEAWDIHPVLRRAVALSGFDTFFNIQRQVVPLLIQTSLRRGGGSGLMRDTLVSAPTGSGKTLSYVLPILDALLPRVVRRLRALVVVPTRELALQGKAIFDRWLTLTRRACVEGGHHRHELTAGVALGHTSIQVEQQELLTPDGASKVDILVVTPGRLTAHLTQSAMLGFTLQHLEFLVVDEADRLMSQNYNDFIHRLLHAAHHNDHKHGQATVRPVRFEATSASSVDPFEIRGHTGAHSVIPERATIAEASTRAANPDPVGQPRTPLRRILLSATLTADPGKLAALRLLNPTFCSVANSHRHEHARTQEVAATPGPTFAAMAKVLGSNGGEEDGGVDDNANGSVTVSSSPCQEKKTYHYSTPVSLKEYLVVTPLSQKPLVLLHLLRGFASRNEPCLVFAASIEATHRLALLVQLFVAATAAEWFHSVSPGSNPASSSPPHFARCVFEFSRSVAQSERSRLVGRLRRGDWCVVVCSDSLARGIDIDSVANVVSYDVPVYAKTYVHRVGRTARAGKDGSAYTLAEPGRVRHFRTMLNNVDNGDLEALDVPPDELQAMLPHYIDCLGQLKALLARSAGRRATR